MGGGERTEEVADRHRLTQGFQEKLSSQSPWEEEGGYGQGGTIGLARHCSSGS